MSQTLTRPGDMHPITSLNVHLQDDGDVVLWVGHPRFPSPDPDCEKEVEFTTIGSGGGRSPHTYKALRNLIEAIKRDNDNEPIYSNRGDGKIVEISYTSEWR
jgi:hypothetical protein